MEQIKGTVNRVELVGWIGAEPEQRFIPSGTPVCSFRVATKRWLARGEDGARAVDTDWTTVETWEKRRSPLVFCISRASLIIANVPRRFAFRQAFSLRRLSDAAMCKMESQRDTASARSAAESPSPMPVKSPRMNENLGKYRRNVVSFRCS